MNIKNKVGPKFKEKIEPEIILKYIKRSYEFLIAEIENNKIIIIQKNENFKNKKLIEYYVKVLEIDFLKYEKLGFNNIKLIREIDKLINVKKVNKKIYLNDLNNKNLYKFIIFESLRDHLVKIKEGNYLNELKKYI